MEKLIKLSSERDLENLVIELGYTVEDFQKFQKKRLIKTFIIFFLFIPLALLKSWYFAPIGFLLSLFLFKLEYINVQKKVKKLRFNKQLVFSKFARMVIPYLMQSHATLYSVFNKLLKRIDDGEVKSNLQRLMIEMLEKPNDVEPFQKFAIKSSGTDSSILFMTTLYDYQQNTHDTNVITELGKIASEELFETVDEIVSYKLKQFSMFPTKLTMASFLIVLGYAISILINAFTKVNFQ